MPAKFLRVHQVKKFLLEGSHRADILQFCAETWKIENRQADTYIQEARAMIRDDMQSMGLADAEWHIASRLHIYSRAAEINDYPTALRVLDSLAKIQGYLDNPGERRRRFDLGALPPEQKAQLIMAAARKLGLDEFLPLSLEKAMDGEWKPAT